MWCEIAVKQFAASPLSMLTGILARFAEFTSLHIPARATESEILLNVHIKEPYGIIIVDLHLITNNIIT